MDSEDEEVDRLREEREFTEGGHDAELTILSKSTLYHE